MENERGGLRPLQVPLSPMIVAKVHTDVVVVPFVGAAGRSSAVLFGGINFFAISFKIVAFRKDLLVFFSIGTV